MLDEKDFIGTDDIFITADTLPSNNFKEMVYPGNGEWDDRNVLSQKCFHVGLSYSQVLLKSVISHIPNISIWDWFSLTMTLNVYFWPMFFLSSCSRCPIITNVI